MPTYATQANCLANIEGLTIDDTDAFDRLIERAERDIDSILGGYPYRDDTTGLKLTPSDLDAWRAAALMRAVCAQVEYRMKMGEDFFIVAQRDSERGPDFAVTGKLPYIGPKVWVEINGSGLRRVGLRAHSGPSYRGWRGTLMDDGTWDDEPAWSGNEAGGLG